MDEKDKQPQNNGNLKTVRTYLSDMADTVRANEISVIKVALAEQNKHEREDLYRKAEGTPLSKILWIIGGIILIIGAITGIYFIMQKKAKDNIPQQITKEETLISYDEIYNLDLAEGDNIIDKIVAAQKEVNTSGKDNSIKFISISNEIAGVKEKIPVKEFFQRIQSEVPSSLIRSLSDSYMIGTYKKDSTSNDKASLFIIFQVSDYSYAYAGMLEWEKTMAGEMYDLFGLKTNQNRLQINQEPFKDVIMWNKDARILYNENGTPILYYLFTDKNNLIITDNSDAIKEIMARLVIKNIKPL